MGKQESTDSRVAAKVRDVRGPLHASIRMQGFHVDACCPRTTGLRR
jgi:hypothetical protein